MLIGQSFSGTVSVLERDGTLTDLFNEPGVDGVSFGIWGSVIYTHSDFETGVKELKLRTWSGRDQGHR